jgi:phosphotriesterase-related protein
VLTRRQAIGILGGGLALAGRTFAATPQFPKGAIVRTVLKDMPPEGLAGGATLVHEHLSLSPDFVGKLGGPTASDPAPGEKFFPQDLDLLTEELRIAAREGVSCVVDGGHPDMGRSLDFLIKLSTASGMPIVSGTGYFAQPFYPPEVVKMTEDQISRELIRQVNAERYGAFGEIGTSDVMTPDERKVFRAVGKAHVATNLPIFTHTNFGKGAMEQLDILEDEGVKLQHVAVGQVGGLIDEKVQIHKELCKRGAFVGFDRQGGPGDEKQVPMVLALIEAGYADNLLFASDFSSAAQLKRNGGAGYAKTVTVFAAALRKAGVKEETLHGILVDNPRRFLAFVPKPPKDALKA